MAFTFYTYTCTFTNTFSQGFAVASASFSASGSAGGGGGGGTCCVDVIAPSLASHGFAKGSGIKSLIPIGHDLLLGGALTEASRGGGGGGSHICWRKYDRQGWTFHTKGLWVRLFDIDNNKSSSLSQSQFHPLAVEGEEEEGGENIATGVSSPPLSASDARAMPSSSSITYIGSSNCGERSWTRDFELGFVMVTRNRGLQEELQLECARLQQHSNMYEHPPLAKPHFLSEIYNFFLFLLANLLKTFL